MRGGGSRLSADLDPDEVNPQNTGAAAGSDGLQAANGAEGAENAENTPNPYSYDAYADAAKAPAVTRVFIPASVERIDPAFFQLFPNAAAVEVAQDSAHFSSHNGMLLDAARTNLLLVPEGMEGDAVLPETLATVPACVFSRCTKLSAIVATQSAGGAATSAFASQDGILYTNDMKTLLAAPAGLGASARIAPECATIAEGAFRGNAALRTIVAPGSVKAIAANPGFDPLAGKGAEASAFSPVPAFDPEVVEGATVSTVDRAAWEAAGFKGFAQPAEPGQTAEADGFAYTLLDDGTLSVRWAGKDAAPAELTIPQTGRVGGIEYSVSTVERDAFKGQEGIRALAVPEGVSTIGQSAFEGCASLESVKLAGSVTAIGEAAFKGCAALTGADLGGGLRTLGASALEGTALEAVTLPATLTAVGARALAANASLQRVAALGDAADVDGTALADCAGVEVYTPYRPDGAYAWSAGVPATGNHLLPYGVQLPAEPLTLHQDETASLIEGGYLEAAGSVRVGFSYDANPISVDPGSGDVTAKQTGRTTVVATLTLDGTTLASAARPVVVALAPEPVEDGSEGESDSGKEAVGENGATAEELKALNTPDIPYDEQLDMEGEFFEGGLYEAQEKIINRTVQLADMGVSPMSLEFETATVGDYDQVVAGNAASGVHVTYTANTRTLTIDFTGGYKWDSGDSNSASASSGHTSRIWRKTENRMKAIRHIVVNNPVTDSDKWAFANMVNLESFEVTGSTCQFGYNPSSSSKYGSVTQMFWNCPQLRVIPSNLVLYSEADISTKKVFGFNSTQRDSLSAKNQLVGGKLLTSYAGSNPTVKSALAATTEDDIRSTVDSYHTVTFDNQGGYGGHQTVGQSSGAASKTYTIRVPHGSPVPELAGTPSYYQSGRYWTFGGYVDSSTSTAPKQYVKELGYPHWSVGAKSWMAITSNKTLYALWYRKASFNVNGGAWSTDGSYYVNLVKGNPINRAYDMTNAGSLYSNLDTHLGRVWNGSTQWSSSSSATNTAPQATNGARPFRGYTAAGGSGTYVRSVKWYNEGRGATAQVYNEPYDFYAMWGFYTVNLYSNIDISWHTQYMRWQNWQTTEYGVRDTGTSAKNYGSAYTIQDVYGFNRWNGNFQMFNSSTVGTHTSSADQWDSNCRDVIWHTPTYYSLKEIRKDSPTGEVISTPSGNDMQFTLTGNMNIYLIFNDNTPNDTITWKINGGYWDNNVSATGDKTTTVRRGTAITVPNYAKARSQTAEYTYAFKGWGTSANATTTVTPGNANGNATYYAIWTATKRSYSITWNLGLSGAYWGTNKGDTGNKTVSWEYGKKPTQPAVPAKAATSNTRWTFTGWSPAISSVTGNKTYTAQWKVEYLTTWKLGSTEAYWGTSKTDKADRTKWVQSGTVPTAPATPKRDAVAQYTYSFSSWNPAPAALNGPQTYTVIWDQKVNSYETTWDVNGGYWNANKGDTAQKKTGSKAYGTVLTGPAGNAPNKARYTFVGWSTNKNANPDKPSEYSASISVVGATTYYAIYRPNDYTVKLMKNDGTDETTHGPQVGSVTATYDRSWTIGAGNVPSRRGYFFLGWDTDPDYAGMTPKYPMKPGADGKYVDATFNGNLIGADGPSEAVLYAVWNESRYTVIFHENWGADASGTGTVPARIDLLYSQQVEIPTNDLARTGYNFDSWNTKADGSGGTYKTRGKYVQVGLTDFDDAHVRGCTVHLYAQWDANQYIVQFDPNIAISDPQDKGEWHIEAGDEVKLVQYGQDVGLDTVFSRPGYEFIGWSFDKNVPADDDDTPIVDFRMQADGTFNPGILRDLTTEKLGVVRLYAQWKGGGYAIQFDGNGTDDRPVQVGSGGAMGSLQMHYGVAKKLPANTFTCNGFTFKGWNTKADGTGESYLDQALVQDVPGVAAGTVKLYAQWAPILSLTTPIDACIEVYIDGMDMYVYQVRPGAAGSWPAGNADGSGTKDDHEDEFTHGQAAIESRTPAKLFIEQIDCVPNLDPDDGMARIFPVDGEPALDSWEDFELEFTALNEATGKNVRASTEFGNSYAFVPGAKNNYYIPAYDAATDTPGKLDYSLLLRIPDDEAREPNTVRYAEGPVKIATLVFTCRVAE